MVYAVIFLAGIVFMFIPGFGVKLDINFSGGTKIAYSYTGDVKDADIEAAVKEVIKKSFTVSKSTSLTGDTKTFEISLVGKDSVSAEDQEKLTTTLEDKFKDNKIELYNSNSVSPTVAGSFFAKSLVAVLITAVLVIIYVGIRFKRIGGISAAITALCALVFDVFITFFTCVFFRLQLVQTTLRWCLPSSAIRLTIPSLFTTVCVKTRALCPRRKSGRLLTRALTPP